MANAKQSIPVIDIGESNQAQEFVTHSVSGKKYACPRLFDYAKDLPVFEMPLAGMDLKNTPFDDSNMIDLAYHCRKVNEADLKWPIILFPDGTVADGRHRIIKALMTGQPTIKAVRMTWWPQPCATVNVDD